MTDGSPTGDNRRIAKDTAFHLLQNHRRRAALRYLFDQEEEVVKLREMADEIAAWENDAPVDDVTSAERQRVYISLYQSHLPKLADADIIEYDKDEGTIRLLPLAAALKPFLGDGLDDQDTDYLTIPDPPEDHLPPHDENAEENRWFHSLLR